jgi:hypothetical protein
MKNKNSEHREWKIAQNWYFWLWLAPVFYIPTAIFLGINLSLIGLSDGAIHAWTLLLNAFWHLIFLIPMFSKRSLVCCHGCQAALLVLIGTIKGAFLGMFISPQILFPLLAAFWFFGTLLSQLEAARGKCTLRRLFRLEEAQATGS